jgi:hypothetical protein
MALAYINKTINDQTAHSFSLTHRRGLSKRPNLGNNGQESSPERTRNEKHINFLITKIQHLYNPT